MWDTEKIVFQNSRLNGIFGNANIEASIYAIGIFCAIALVCGAEKKWQRALWAAAAAVDALAFLLVFSMGAMACFACGSRGLSHFCGQGARRGAAAYAGGRRACVYGAALPRLPCSAAGASGLCCRVLLANAAAAAVLELTVMEKLSRVLEKHQRAAFGVLIGRCALRRGLCGRGAVCDGVVHLWYGYLPQRQAQCR